MIDWDDVRYLLAVGREGSVRAAASRLGVIMLPCCGVSRSSRTGSARMFEWLPSGYRPTVAGEEVLELASQMELLSHQLETRVLGRDESVRGLLRVTMSPPVATHLLMPHFAEIARRYPEIEMDLLWSGELAILTQPRSRCRDPRRLRSQDGAAQSSRTE